MSALAAAEAPGQRLIRGWAAKTPAVAARVVPCSGSAELDALFDEPHPRGLIARGAGHSMGDAAQRAGGTVVSTERQDQIHAFDSRRGVVTVGGGLSLGRLMEAVVPHGWMPAAIPTTRFVTVGGAIAADLHGRNQHRDGSFASHLESFVLRTPTGTSVADPESDPFLFWATAGGMGLTGVILEATLRLIPIETASMRVWTKPLPDLDSVMAGLDKDSSRYAAAWIDCCSRGGSAGRGIILRGEHAGRDEVENPDARVFVPTPRLRLPNRLPPLLRGRRTRAFNEVVFRLVSRRSGERLVPIGRFFHIHDRVDSWLPLCGPPGFIEYQFVVPARAGDLVAAILNRLRQARVEPFFAALKRFGPGNPGALAFPGAGWMVGLDLAAQPGLSPVLRQLDVMVAEAGGRVYLAKDARLAPDVFATMYPGVASLRQVRDRHDPRGTIRSDLSVRLEI